jgi:hypothetical protein
MVVRLWVFACEESTHPETGSHHIYSTLQSRAYAICASGDLIFVHLRHACYKFVARCVWHVDRGWGADGGCAIRHLNQEIETK